MTERKVRPLPTERQIIARRRNFAKFRLRGAVAAFGVLSRQPDILNSHELKELRKADEIITALLRGWEL